MDFLKIDLTGAIKAGTDLIDEAFTTDEEKLKMALEEKKEDNKLLHGQQAINIEQAKHPSIFVAGARPAAMWVCVFGLGYQFLFYPLLVWLFTMFQAFSVIPIEVLTGVGETAKPFFLSPPPALNIETLFSLLGGTLGLSGYRSFEKSKGVARDNLKGR